MADVDVRRPQKSDVTELAATLARAFQHDPVMAWMIGDDARRAKGLPQMFAAMTRHHFLAGGGAEVACRDGAIGAAALWDAPGGGSTPTAKNYGSCRPCCSRWAVTCGAVNASTT